MDIEKTNIKDVSAIIKAMESNTSVSEMSLEEERATDDELDALDEYLERNFKNK